MSAPVGPCGWVHTSMTAIAVGRFDPLTAGGYRAASGGPIRSTRAAAERDECNQQHTPPSPNPESETKP